MCVRTRVSVCICICVRVCLCVCVCVCVLCVSLIGSRPYAGFFFMPGQLHEIIHIPFLTSNVSQHLYQNSPKST